MKDRRPRRTTILVDLFLRVEWLTSAASKVSLRAINNCVSGEDSLSRGEFVARAMCSQVREVVGVGSLHLYIGETTVHVVFSSFRLGVLIEGFDAVCFCVLLG